MITGFLEFKDDCTIYNLDDHIWSGAKERWSEADDNTREAVWERLCEWCEGIDELPTITQINDILWFECDDLFYPPKFRIDYENQDGESFSETFTGLYAEAEAREWWENKIAEDETVNVESAVIINEDTEYSEPL